MKKLRKFYCFFYAVGVFYLVEASHASDNGENKSIIVDSENDVSQNGANQINSLKRSIIVDDKSDMGYKKNKNNQVRSNTISPQNFQNTANQNYFQKPIQINEQQVFQDKYQSEAQYNVQNKNLKSQKGTQFDDIPDINNEKQNIQKDLQKKDNKHDDVDELKQGLKLNPFHEKLLEIDRRSNMREGISTMLVDFNKEKMPRDFVFEKGMDLKYPFSRQRSQILDDLNCIHDMNFDRYCFNMGLAKNFVIGYCQELNNCYVIIIRYIRFVFLGENNRVLSNEVKDISRNIKQNVDLSGMASDSLSIVSELNNKNIVESINDQNLDLSRFMQNRDISAKPSYNGHIEKIQEKENSQILQRSNIKNTKIEKDQYVGNDQSRMHSEQNEEVALNHNSINNKSSNLNDLNINQLDGKHLYSHQNISQNYGQGSNKKGGAQVQQKYYEKLKGEARKHKYNVKKEDIDHLMTYISDFKENYPNELVTCKVLCCFPKYDIRGAWFLVDFLIKVQKTGLVDVTLMPAVWRLVNVLNFFVDKL